MNRLPFSLRNVEDLLVWREIDICHETVRLWGTELARFSQLAFGHQRMRGFRHWKWHLDEMYVRPNDEMEYWWRAVDQKGEVPKSCVIRKRDKSAALHFTKTALKRHGPENISFRMGNRTLPRPESRLMSSPEACDQ